MKFIHQWTIYLLNTLFDDHGFFPTGVFLSIRFLYIFVKLNITVHQFEINSIIIMICFSFFAFFLFFSFFSFLSSSFSLAIFKSLKLYYVLLYRVTGRKPANNCCADNRNNTLIKKQSINQSIKNIKFLELVKVIKNHSTCNPC